MRYAFKIIIKNNAELTILDLTKPWIRDKDRGVPLHESSQKKTKKKIPPLHILSQKILKGKILKKKKAKKQLLQNKKEEDVGAI